MCAQLVSYRNVRPNRRFSARSLNNLRGVHPDLVRIAWRALFLSPVDFIVIEGLRTPERQRELYAYGATRTLNSRHLHGFAIDLLPINPDTGRGEFSWPLYHQLAPVMKAVAGWLGVPIVWGGDWARFRDGPHFELPRSEYPDRLAFRAIEPEQLRPDPSQGTDWA